MPSPASDWGDEVHHWGGIIMNAEAMAPQGPVTILHKIRPGMKQAKQKKLKLSRSQQFQPDIIEARKRKNCNLL